LEEVDFNHEAYGGKLQVHYKTVHPPYTNPTNPYIRKLAMQTADEIEVELDKYFGTL
jgi:hypothetical protein